jgi:hypothetical protein
MTANVKLSKSAKNDLITMKTDFGYSTYSILLEDVCSFFNRNKMTPKDNIDNNFFSVLSMQKQELLREILEVKKFIKSDSQSMRKLLRALEKDHFVKLSTKVSFLTDEARERNAKNILESTYSSSTKTEYKQEEKTEQNSDIVLIKEQAKTILEMEKTLQKQDLILEKREKNFKTIFDFYKIEKNTFGKEKVVIDMDREEFEKLFNI